MSETKNCQNCKKDFIIEPDDFSFYEKIGVPAPKMCPSCRRNRRLAFGNYTTLYQRTNNAPGGGKVISCYPEEAPFPVFDTDYHLSNDHHAEDYSVVYTPNESFFSQFKKLSDIVPRPAMTRDPSNIDSGFSNYGSGLKNSFYTFGGLNTENVAYSMWGLFTRDSQDVLISLNCERLYEAVFPEHCARSAFTYISQNVLDSYFMYDCRDCSDCIGCVNLRHKKFHIWNQNVGEEEYKKIKTRLKDGSFQTYSEFSEKFWKLVHSLPVRGTRSEHTQDSTGIYLIHCRNCKDCVWCLESADSRYVEFVLKVRSSYDVSISDHAESLYNTALTGVQSWNNICTVNNKNCGGCQYSMDLRDCKNCFGCIGLDHKEFCIFNTQYTEEEYKKTVEVIKNKMIEDGTYGEFFPYSLSPFPYNASIANVIYPKSKEDIAAIGSYTSEPASNISTNTKVISAKDMPDTLSQTNETITSVAIESSLSGRPFSIRKDDLVFHKGLSVPLPRMHPYERMKARFKVVNNFVIEDCVCKKCGFKFKGALPSSEYITYCEDCYQREVI